MNRICPECGQEFKINSRFQNSKKYCSERCSQAVIKRRKQNKTIKQPASKRKRKCYEKCCDCLYSAPKEDSNKCDYMYLTAEKRGCPSGADCTRYKKSTPNERRKYRKKVMSKWDNTFTHKIK